MRLAALEVHFLVREHDASVGQQLLLQSPVGVLDDIWKRTDGPHATYHPLVIHGEMLSRSRCRFMLQMKRRPWTRAVG